MTRCRHRTCICDDTGSLVQGQSVALTAFGDRTRKTARRQTKVMPFGGVSLGLVHDRLSA